MLYINDPKQLFKTYDEAVDAAVANGVERKRAYVYLAALGVKSAMARVMSADEVGYLDAVQVAVKDKKVVTKISVCKSCQGLVIK